MVLGATGLMVEEVGYKTPVPTERRPAELITYMLAGCGLFDGPGVLMRYEIPLSQDQVDQILACLHVGMRTWVNYALNRHGYHNRVFLQT